MKNLKILGIIVLVAALAGGFALLKSHSMAGASLSAGTTASTKGFASVDYALSAGSSTSLYNGDSYDRYVTESFAYCQNLGTALDNTGAGVANLTLQVATTSTSSLGLQGSTNYVANIASIATNTPSGYSYVSTTTAPVLGDYGRVWPTGKYLTFQFNATSSTAFCTIGASYLR